MRFSHCGQLLATAGQVPVPATGLPDFSRYNLPKREKIYQMTTNCTKCS
jgi:hypothetical protein